MQEVTAKLRFYRMGPRKVRLVADLIRGKKALRAVDMLTLLNKKVAHPLLKLLNSAIANAKHNHNLPAEVLYVSKITVDGGPVLKRFTPKAHGRATPIRERTSHINLVLSGEVVEKKEKIKKVKAAKSSKITAEVADKKN